MDISRLEYRVREHLGEYSTKVFDSPRQINFIPLEKSLELVELFGPFQRLSGEEQDSSLGEKISHILVLAQEIEENYQKAVNVFNQVRERFKDPESETFTLTDQELEEVEFALLSKGKEAIDLVLNPDKVYEIVCKYFANNAAVKSGLFQEGATISVAELMEAEPKVAYHAKKTAFDQACESTFGRHTDDYSKGLMVEYVGSSHPLNSLMGGDSIKDSQLAIVFISMDKINPLNVPKFGEILDPNSGKMLKINHLQQEDNEEKTLKIPCQVGGKNVIIEVPIYKGVVIGERS